MATPYGMVPVLVLLVPLPDYRTYHQTISTYVHLAVANDLATMLLAGRRTHRVHQKDITRYHHITFHHLFLESITHALTKN